MEMDDGPRLVPISGVESLGLPLLMESAGALSFEEEFFAYITFISPITNQRFSLGLDDKDLKTIQKIVNEKIPEALHAIKNRDEFVESELQKMLNENGPNSGI